MTAFSVSPYTMLLMHSRLTNNRVLKHRSSSALIFDN